MSVQPKLLLSVLPKKRQAPLSEEGSKENSKENSNEKNKVNSKEKSKENSKANSEKIVEKSDEVPKTEEYNDEVVIKEKHGKNIITKIIAKKFTENVIRDTITKGSLVKTRDIRMEITE